MRELHFSRQWWVLLLENLLTLPLLGVGWGITWPLVDQWAHGRLSVTAWPWWSVVGADIVLLILVGILYWIPLVTLLTVFTEEGVSQPGLLRRTSIRWSEVTRLCGRWSAATIRSRNKAITVNLWLFKDPNGLVADIERRVPVGTPLS